MVDQDRLPGVPLSERLEHPLLANAALGVKIFYRYIRLIPSVSPEDIVGSAAPLKPLMLWGVAFQGMAVTGQDRTFGREMRPVWGQRPTRSILRTSVMVAGLSPNISGTALSPDRLHPREVRCR